MLFLSGFAARADTSAETTADGFLMQHELDAMLSNLDASPWPTRYCFGYVDYAGKKWTAFDYVCPICGTRTSYPERTRISLWGTGYEAFLANLRQTVEFLRGKRLDVRVDERILCSSCRGTRKTLDPLAQLTWTINGREIEIESDDCLLLRTFFSGQREIPGREINASLKEARNRRRLGQLLSSRPPLSRKPNPEAVLKDLSRPGGWTNGEITVENF